MRATHQRRRTLENPSKHHVTIQTILIYAKISVISVPSAGAANACYRACLDDQPRNTGSTVTAHHIAWQARCKWTMTLYSPHSCQIKPVEPAAVSSHWLFWQNKANPPCSRVHLASTPFQPSRSRHVSHARVNLSGAIRAEYRLQWRPTSWQAGVSLRV